MCICCRAKRRPPQAAPPSIWTNPQFESKPCRPPRPPNRIFFSRPSLVPPLPFRPNILGVVKREQSAKTRPDLMTAVDLRCGNSEQMTAVPNANHPHHRHRHRPPIRSPAAFCQTRSPSRRHKPVPTPCLITHAHISPPPYTCTCVSFFLFFFDIAAELFLHGGNLGGGGRVPPHQEKKSQGGGRSAEGRRRGS